MVTASIGALLIGTSITGCAPVAPAPPGFLAALINSSAPRNDVSGTQFCAGVLVSKHVVLTAAHCVRGRTPASIDVVVGANNLCSTGPITGQRLHVRSIRRSATLDAAELTIESAATATPARIAKRATKFYEAWGWGKDSIGGVAPCMAMSKALSAVRAHACLPALTQVAASERARYLCAVPAAQRNTCEGDSGGPVLSPDGLLVAITIGGVGCGPHDPGTYLAAASALGAG